MVDYELIKEKNKITVNVKLTPRGKFARDLLIINDSKVSKYFTENVQNPQSWVMQNPTPKKLVNEREPLTGQWVFVKKSLDKPTKKVVLSNKSKKSVVDTESKVDSNED
jgi:hypothetical protein